MDDTKMIIQRLQKAQKGSGLSYAALEKKTGIGHSSIQRYFTGKSKIPLNDIQKLCQALGVDPAEILGWSGKDESISAERAALISLCQMVPEAKVHLLYTMIRAILEAQ